MDLLSTRPSGIRQKIYPAAGYSCKKFLLTFRLPGVEIVRTRIEGDITSSHIVNHLQRVPLGVHKLKLTVAILDI